LQLESDQLTPVHDDVPDAAVDTVDRRKQDEKSHHLRRPLNAKQTQRHASKNCEAILSAINQVREHIACIVVTPQALKRAPYARNRREETKKSRVRAITHCWLVPVACVQAEEKLKMAHSVCQRAEHVAEEEVAELDRVNTSKQQSPVAVQEPAS
jgi:hypothetical protein